mmetsp:Transcript_139598/g.242924  ORF Transcript_139598/g.242924 Transcript_139598/m.242924 type:complete len:141 (+) Transcript_139598:2114-2536(+)
MTAVLHARDHKDVQGCLLDPQSVGDRFDYPLTVRLSHTSLLLFFEVVTPSPTHLPSSPLLLTDCLLCLAKYPVLPRSPQTSRSHTPPTRSVIPMVMMTVHSAGIVVVPPCLGNAMHSASVILLACPPWCFNRLVPRTHGL